MSMTSKFIFINCDKGFCNMVLIIIKDKLGRNYEEISESFSFRSLSRVNIVFIVYRQYQIK